MIDVDGLAKEAGKAVRDAAARVKLPDLMPDGRVRRRRTAFATAAAAFAVTILVAGIALIGNRSQSPEPDVATPSDSIGPTVLPPVTTLPAGSPATDVIYAGNAFVLDDGDGPEVCGAVMDSLPPQCSGPRLIGLDWSDVPWAESAQGVTWTTMYVEFSVIDGELVLAGAPEEPKDVTRATGPDFPAPAASFDLSEITSDLAALGTTGWHPGIVAVSGWWANEAEGWVGLDALIVTDEGQRWLDERYGVGAVRATGLFLPLESVTVSQREPAEPSAPALPGEPDTVRARDTLYYCGATAGERVGADAAEELLLTIDPSAEACFEERVTAGLPAEWILVQATIEGDLIVSIYRSLPDGSMEVFTDSTRDAFGSRGWTRASCQGVTFDPFGVTDCREEITE